MKDITLEVVNDVRAEVDGLIEVGFLRCLQAPHGPTRVMALLDVFSERYDELRVDTIAFLLERGREGIADDETVQKAFAGTDDFVIARYGYVLGVFARLIDSGAVPLSN